MNFHRFKDSYIQLNLLPGECQQRLLQFKALFKKHDETKKQPEKCIDIDNRFFRIAYYRVINAIYFNAQKQNPKKQRGESKIDIKSNYKKSNIFIGSTRVSLSIFCMFKC